MQIDMHYYSSYSIARLAGLTPGAAKMIATCAQFVDDNTASSNVTFTDGARIDSEATAHHTIDVNNLEPHDQRRVWVPFHFIPGNVGESYTERLKCRKNSAIAQQMCAHHLSLSAAPYALALMGIMTHVYQDTFSHYGFSGVSSGGNRVVNDSFNFGDHHGAPIIEYINGKKDKFFDGYGEHGGLLDNIKSWLGENLSGALGHGSVATFPDRPFLHWQFDYERPDAVDGITSQRSNPDTYLEACRALHSLFIKLVQQRSDLDNGDGREFDEVSDLIAGIIKTEADKEARIQSWKDAASEGQLFANGSEGIPDYEGNSWNDIWAELDGTENSGDVFDIPIWQFYQAAAVHRTYVLRQLLPEHGIIVD